MSYPTINFDSLLHRIPFGKHKGKQIGNVIVQDTEYVEWLFSQNNIKVHPLVIGALETYKYYAK